MKGRKKRKQTVVRKVSRKKICEKTKKKTSKKLFSKKDLKKFKDLLIKLKNNLMDEIEHIAKGTLKTSQRDASGDLSGYTLHMADVASDHYEREFSLGIATTEQKTIYEIDEALKTIEDGTYGICAGCEKSISKRRLTAVPHTKCCIECQKKEELIQKRGIG